MGLMMDKKGIAMFLVKPALWLLYILIVVVFLILFTLGGIGSSRDSSVVSAEMPEFITTIEAINYLRTPVGDATVGDLIIKAVKRKDVFNEMNFEELEEKTDLKLEDIELEDYYTITLSVDRPGKTQEVEFYFPSNLKDYDYVKIVMEIPYEK